MPRYEHLPIYKKALDVAVHFEKVVAEFSRFQEYTLGSELRNQSRAVVRAIVKANSEGDELPALFASVDNTGATVISSQTLQVAHCPLSRFGLWCADRRIQGHSHGEI